MAAASTQRTGRDYRTNLWKDLQVFSPEGSHFSECDSSNSVSSLEFSSSCYQEICVNMSNRGSQRPNLFPAQMTDSHHPLVDAGTPGDARVVSPAHDGYFAPTGGVPSNCNPFGPRLRPPLQSSFRSPASNHGGPSPCPQSREVYSQVRVVLFSIDSCRSSFGFSSSGVLHDSEKVAPAVFCILQSPAVVLGNIVVCKICLDHYDNMFHYTRYSASSSSEYLLIMSTVESFSYAFRISIGKSSDHYVV